MLVVLVLRTRAPAIFIIVVLSRRHAFSIGVCFFLAIYSPRRKNETTFVYLEFSGFS